MPTKKRDSGLHKDARVAWYKRPLQAIANYWRASLIRQCISVIVAVVIIFTAGMYGVGQWYIFKHKNEPLRIGATFIPNYAEYFGLDPQDTMQKMIDELGIKQFRLVSYWKDIEPIEGQYDFSSLDWQFAKANAAGAKVSLAIGLRQPRWPECHAPTWAQVDSIHEWYPKLKTYMQKVIERYGNNPALESYQLENEFFMKVFGICPDHSRWRLDDEFNFVKSLDSDTPVIVSRSNNWVGLPLGDPRPDRFGISVYKRVWDKTLTKRYFEYPLPAWFYASLAGGAEILTGKDMVIHELQAEAWLPEGMSMLDAPVSEINKSLNPQRLKDRIKYADATGMRDIYLWGPEWWLYLKEKRNYPDLWNTAVTELKN